jgi:tetratricopeptide (TPR) repeat protein
MMQKPDNNNPEELLSLEELIDKARHVAKAGDLEQSFDLIYGAIRFAENTGYPQIAMLLIETLDTFLDVNQLKPASRAWLLNSKGLALQSLGRIEESAQALNDMRSLGETLGDKQIIATALMNLGTQALLIGNAELACELLNRSLPINHEIGNYRQAIQIRLNLVTAHIQACDLEAAEAQLSIVQELVEAWNDPHLLATFYGNAGTIKAKRGDFGDARKNYQAALKNARRSDNLMAETNTLQNLGALNLDEGLPNKAMRWFKRALKITERTESIISQESVYSGLAIAFLQAGRLQKAAESFQQARKIAEQLGNRHARARYAADLGAIFLMKKESKAAKPLLQEALDIFKELGDKQWEYRVLRNMIETHWVNGDREEAMQAVEQALAALTPKSNAEKAELFGQVAKLWLGDITELKRASYYFKRQLFQVKKLDKLEALAWRSALAGAALAKSGGLKFSIPFYTRAIEIYRSIGDDHMTFHTLNDRAIAYSDLGRYRNAITDFKSCLDLAKRYDDRVMRLQTLLNWGETTRRKGDTGGAISKLRKAVLLSRKLADQESEAQSLANLGIALSDAKRWEVAQSTFRLARDMARAIKQPATEASAVGGLAGVAFARGRFKTASKLYEEAVRLRSAERSDRQFLEDLAGLVQSLAAAGEKVDIKYQAQRLVDVAQQILETEFASEALMRAARWFLKRSEFEEAVSLYAVGIAIAGVGPEDNMINRLSKACLMMAFHIQIEASGQEKLFEQVVDQLNSSYKGIGEHLRDLINLARQHAAEFDNIQQ